MSRAEPTRLGAKRHLRWVFVSVVGVGVLVIVGVSAGIGIRYSECSLVGYVPIMKLYTGYSLGFGGGGVSLGGLFLWRRYRSDPSSRYLYPIGKYSMSVGYLFCVLGVLLVLSTDPLPCMTTFTEAVMRLRPF